MGCSSHIVTVTALKLGLKPVLSPSSLCVKRRPSARDAPEHSLGHQPGAAGLVVIENAVGQFTGREQAL